VARSRNGPARAQGQAELLSRKEAAAYLGVTVQTLAIWKSAERYDLPVIKVGRLARYRKEDLDRFLDSRTVDTAHNKQRRKQKQAEELVKLRSRQKSVEFAEVQVVDHGPGQPSLMNQGSTPLEIVLPSGISFRVSEGCSLNLLGSVISYLENR
jgi:excisionase family DNA binding protein